MRMTCWQAWTLMVSRHSTEAPRRHPQMYSSRAREPLVAGSSNSSSRLVRLVAAIMAAAAAATHQAVLAPVQALRLLAGACQVLMGLAWELQQGLQQQQVQVHTVVQLAHQAASL